MDWKKGKKITQWPSYFSDLYHEFLKESKRHRCKIVGINTSQRDDVIFDVVIYGMKNQILQYSAQELVSNHLILNEFSGSDVRAITFYAMKENVLHHHAPYRIIGQNIKNGKTAYIIKKDCHFDRYGCALLRVFFEPTEEDVAKLIFSKYALLAFNESLYFAEQNVKKIEKIPCHTDNNSHYAKLVASINSSYAMATQTQLKQIEKLTNFIEERDSGSLYSDENALLKFDHQDLKNIISTAIQEQTISDMST